MFGYKKKQIDVEEEYKRLRRNIDYVQSDKPMHVIYVTSTFPKEGRTMVAFNLAKKYAAKKAKTLFIDCSFDSLLCSRLEVEVKPGSLKESISKYTFDSGETMDILPLYPHPLKNDVLDSEEFRTFIKEARTTYEKIIMDGQCVSTNSDAFALANIADGTVFVINSKDTNMNQAKMAVAELKRNGANLIGLVLTKNDQCLNGRY